MFGKPDGIQTPTTLTAPSLFASLGIPQFSSNVNTQMFPAKTQSQSIKLEQPSVGLFSDMLFGFKPKVNASLTSSDNSVKKPPTKPSNSIFGPVSNAVQPLISTSTANQNKQDDDEKKLFSNQSLCLDCLETFDPTHKHLFNKNHKGHQTVPLKDKDPQHMKQVFWIISMLQSNDPARLERAELTLRMLLDIIDNYMQAVKYVQSSLRQKPEETKQTLLTELRTLLQEGAPVTKWRDNKLLDALFTVRELEVERSEQVFQLARKCNIPQSELMDTDFFDALHRDQKAYVPFGMSEEYLGMFPLLQDAVLMEGQQEEESRPSRLWLESWRGLQPIVAVK
jgi:hypothetical protein